MGILSWIIVGLIAGLLAKWIMPGPQNAGLILTTLLGIVGAVVGGWIMGLITGVGVTGFNLWTLLVATIGALVVLWVFRLVRKA